MNFAFQMMNFAFQMTDLGADAKERLEAARQRKQRVIVYVARAEREQAAARKAAEVGVERLAALGAEARNIWAPPLIPGGDGELLWAAHDGPAPNRYAKEAAAVAECRGASARDRVLSRMVVALEKEVRGRHWKATGLSGPMLRTGIYADYYELINQVRNAIID